MILSSKAKNTTIVSKLKSSSLISLSQLYDNLYNVLLNKTDLKVFKDNRIILKGYKNLRDGL